MQDTVLAGWKCNTFPRIQKGEQNVEIGDKTWGYSYAHVLCMLIAHVNRYKHCKNTWYSSSNFLKHNQQPIKNHHGQSSTIKVHNKGPTATKYINTNSWLVESFKFLQLQCFQLPFLKMIWSTLSIIKPKTFIYI